MRLPLVPHRALAIGILLALAASLWTLPVAWGQSVCGTEIAAAAPEAKRLADFARAHRVKYIHAFVAVVVTLNRTGRLPDCYLNKGRAEQKGWHGGADLWRVAPGAAIGGNRFTNREGRLPRTYDGKYREADIDYAGGHRGTDRLIFAEGGQGKWLIWLTTDHYRHFDKVPAAE